MLKWLNYHHLLYFRIIAKEGSISRASEVLLVGQPALSSQLKNLEETLGQKLFERKNRALILTEAGRVALDYANKIFDTGEEFVQIINNKNLSQNKNYKIGVIDGLPKSLACKLIEIARSVDSNAFISVVEGDHDNLINLLQTHEIDLILSNNQPAAHLEGLYRKEVGEASIYVFGSPEYKDLINDFPRSLNGKSFILPTKHSQLRHEIEHVFQDLKIKYELYAEVQDSSLKKMLANHGKGLIALAEFAGHSFIPDNSLLKIGKLPNISEKYWLVTAKRLLKSQITDSIFKNLKI